MTRARLAAVLGVVAVLCVVATAAVAVTTRDDDPPPQPPALTVRHGDAAFEVPAEDWRVEDPEVRVFYTDERGRPVAVVRGPAVYRPGYCGKDSNQGFAGFTDQGIDAWVGALGEADASGGDAVTLADGTDARLTWARVELAAGGPCEAAEVYVAMVRAGDVRVVVVADAGEPGTLTEDSVRSILLSLT